jgi:hypothetical protein
VDVRVWKGAYCIVEKGSVEKSYVDVRVWKGAYDVNVGETIA